MFDKDAGELAFRCGSLLLAECDNSHLSAGAWLEFQRVQQPGLKLLSVEEST